MTCHTLQLVEGAHEEDREKPYYTISELEEMLEPSTPEARNLIIRALQSMRSAIESYTAAFKTYSRHVHGFSLDLDCPPPRLVGDKLYPGFWVGAYEHHGEKCIRIIVHPHLKRYHEMLEEVERWLLKVAGLQPLVDSLVLGEPTLSIINHMNILAWEALWLAEREPKRYRAARPSETGTILIPAITPEGPTVRVYKITYSPNRHLQAAIAMTVQVLSKTLRSLRELIEEAKEASKQYRSTTNFWSLAQKTLNKLEHTLKALHEHPVIQQALVEPLHYDPGRYSYLVHAARTLARGLTASPEGVRTRQLLYPSTKLYELYTYATLARQFAEKGYTLKTTPRPLQLEVKNENTRIRTYYNHYPPRFSRLIAPLTKKTPKPDILIQQLQPHHQRTIVEVKYRHLNTTKPGTLKLADAIRVAAYLLDVAKDNKLTTIITVLTKPPQHELQHLASKLKLVNGKPINIVILEVNPDTTQENIAAATQQD